MTLLLLAILVFGILTLKLAIKKASLRTYPFKRYRQYSFIFRKFINDIKRMSGYKFLGITALSLLLLSLIWEERNYQRRLIPFETLQPYLTLLALSPIVAQIFLAIFS